MLFLTAVFSGLGCSGGQKSDVNNADISKLNVANQTLRSTAAALDAELQREVSRCVGGATSAKGTTAATCTHKAMVRLAPAMRSAAATAAAIYEQVAKDVHGICQKALRTAARGFRADAAATAVSPDNQRLLKNWKAVLGSCKLRTS